MNKSRKNIRNAKVKIRMINIKEYQNIMFNLVYLAIIVDIVVVLGSNKLSYHLKKVNLGKFTKVNY